MSYVTAAECNAWADKNKLDLTTVDSDLEASVVAEIFARVSPAYDVSGWVDNTTTPSLIRKLIAMQYTGWYYLRTYSEDEAPNNYGLLLLGQVSNLLDGIVTGGIVLPEVTVPSVGGLSEGDFYPNDLSSAMDPLTNPDDTSVGPAKFSMGQIW